MKELRKMRRLAVVIPCYNEEKRLKKSSILKLINHTEQIDVYLSNDGSTDNTANLMIDIAQESDAIKVLNYDKNEGKAKTIFKSFVSLKNRNEYTHFGYLDADFSTESEDYLELYQELLNSDKKYIFGSRIATLNSKIDRKLHRHLIGRGVITFINIFFKFKIYDTQCGAKIFDRQVLEVITRSEFVTNWLFDIEIFIRLTNDNLLFEGIEYPLKKWKDINGSKIRKRDSFFIGRDIFKLIRKYK